MCDECGPAEDILGIGMQGGMGQAENVEIWMQERRRAKRGVDFTAREMLTGLMVKGDKGEMIRPKMKSGVDEKAPGTPNAFSDGRLRNIKEHSGKLEEQGYCTLQGRKLISQRERKR